jgi:hypothetical protein
MSLEVAPAELEEILSRWAELEDVDQSVEGDAEVGLPFRRDPARVVSRTTSRPAKAVAALPPERLARMALVARGRKGTGADYLRELTAAMRAWGIDEPIVTALLREVGKEAGEAWR